MRHAFAHDGRGARRGEQLQAFDHTLGGVATTAFVEPEESEGERGVHRSLCLLRVHAEHGERRVTAAQEPAGVDRAERFLQVHGGSEPLRLHVGETLLQRPLEQPLVGRARGLLRRRRPVVAVAADLELGRLCLPEALHRQAQHAVLLLGFHHAPDGVALSRPEMQHAFSVLGRDAVTRARKIECHLALLAHDRGGSFAEEVLDRARE